MELQSYLREVWSRLTNESDVGIDALAGCLGMPPSDLTEIKLEYDEIVIPKRSGRPRILSVPKGPLKHTQRLILRRLLERLPCHPSATGFRKGCSIVTNASFHTGADVVLGLDLCDFFPNTSDRRVHKFFKRVGWNQEASKELTRLCTHDGGLPQGAPTSPCLSNLVNYRLDCRLNGLARKYGAAYSRYADDITFSFKEKNRVAVFDVFKVSIYVLSRYGYEIKESKTRIVGKHKRQLVTGLVVNERVRLPRETRRLLRAIEHRLANGSPMTMSMEQLNGWRGLMHMVEPKPDGVPTLQEGSPSE